MLKSLSDKVADFSYSRQILLKRKLNIDVFFYFFQGSFLRTTSATVPVKRVPFGVILNAGKNFCHLKYLKFNQCAIINYN